MPRTSTRTANVYTRIDPQVKDQAEEILKQLGIPMSTAIEMFLRQVVIQRGLPFEIKLAASKPLAMGAMTQDEIATEVLKALDEAHAGKGIPSAEVEAELLRW